MSYLVSAKDLRAQKKLLKTLKELSIKVYQNTEVLEMQENGLVLKDVEGHIHTEGFYRALIATQASAPNVV